MTTSAVAPAAIQPSIPWPVSRDTTSPTTAEMLTSRVSGHMATPRYYRSFAPTAKQAVDEPALLSRGVVHVASATLRRGHRRHDLLDMHTATGPRGLPTNTTLHPTTHTLAFLSTVPPWVSDGDPCCKASGAASQRAGRATRNSQGCAGIPDQGLLRSIDTLRGRVRSIHGDR